ncbi:hypothetical protein I8752_21090 [Nostocaceae cyanobacterium CENA369]|uniref:Uncharacterized protein n=1 Tax=Dendronalium phyllosphericum CENA369 TaxID=1725256 RepID=A0A8J7I3S6_9NOST|nr:hypothetical protein [Dendronalium phyllosphericum]MBH8575459.1 hypothetical protein [Dendronalium phyllosphericum CENA369]
MPLLPLTLTQIFGAGATQDSQYLVIPKSDLPGLTPSSNNTAESLVVALLLKALENFEGVLTDENGNTITDENNNPITYYQGDWVELMRVFQWNSSYIKERLGNYYLTNTLVAENFAVYELE